ncbi:MAG TPA: RNA polymerase subunit sigma, partial [Archangium sp.]|nr:RNA polymerase subunit sigma [Archangium sp.]
MADPTDPKQLDKRTAERYLRSGAVEEKAYQRHIESLPDVSDKSVPVETVMHDELENDEDDDFDDEDEG